MTTYREKPPWLLYEVTSTLENGVEVYTRKMDAYFFRNTLPQTAARGADEVKRMAVWHLYVFRDKPHWTQIINVSADPSTLMVTVRIQRGHYFIAEFVTRHIGHELTSGILGDQLEIYCVDCEANIFLNPRSIPSNLPPKID